MTQESLDILSNTPVGETVEVEGRMIKVAALGPEMCVDCCFANVCEDNPQLAPECTRNRRHDRQDVYFMDVADVPSKAPWQNWPDARRDGMCEIPVTVARTLRTVIDNITGNQVLDAGLNANHLIEARIFLDNALNGAKKGGNA
jgi:hypothetical protein